MRTPARRRAPVVAAIAAPAVPVTAVAVTATAIAVFVGAFIVAGCAGIVGEVTARESRDLSLAGVTSTLVRVEVFNGELSVRPGPDGRVGATVTVTGVGATRPDAEADRANVISTLTQAASSVVLRAVYQPDPTNPRNRGASASVTVPAGSALELVTSNGKVSVTGISGAIRIRTSNGETTVDGATGGVDAETSNSAMTVTGSRGPLALTSSNGRIRIDATDAAVKAATSNGEIAFTGSLAAGQHSFETSNAAISLGLGADATFGLDLETSNAKVRVGYPVTTTGTAEATRLSGRVGDAPTASISARTSNAGITIQPRQ